MCGFSVIVSKDPNRRNIEVVKEMQQIAAHRGPDDQGTYQHENILLGHNRLKIIDLSNAGKQPMSRFNYTIVYNGEIYNYKELRQSFEQMGYIFKSDSDTEVILAAYQYYGTQCTLQFNGMWSFAIYDRNREEVFLSVDRFGIKPLYYLKHKACFYFCSEIKQLKAIKDFTFKLNHVIANTYLTTGIKNYSSNTMIEGVNKLMGGHQMMLDCTSEEYNIKKYYTPDLKEINIDFEEAKSHYAKLLQYSVDLRLRADVEVGTSLSGGLDSTIIAALAHKRNGNSKNITFNWEGIASEDFKYAASVTKYLNTKSQYSATINSDELKEKFSWLVYSQEEPFANFSIAAQYKVFEKSKNIGLKVLLSGQGADEALGGYFSFYKAQIKEQLQKRNLFKAAINFAGIPIHQGKETLNVWKSIRNNQIGIQVSDSEEIPKFDGWDHFRNFSKEQILYNSLPAILHYEDRNSMANSVESRLPFMDYRLVEFSLKLPSEYKIKNGIRKYILREAFKGEIPKGVYNRHNKSAFDTPIIDGLTNNYDFFKSRITVNLDRMPEHFDRDNINAIISAFENKPNRSLGSQLIKLASFGEWLERFEVS